MDDPPAPHPTDEALDAYGLGKLDDAAGRQVNDHLMRCAACRRKVAEVSSDSFLERLRGARDGGEPAMPFAGAPHPGGPQAGDPAQSATPRAAGTLPPELAALADYDKIRELGRGGMGVVYLAHNKLMDRDEVLKLLSPHLMEKPGVEERFLREIRTVANLRHPNIVTAYTAFRLGESLVFAMEYVKGEDMSGYVKKFGPRPVEHACNFIYQASLGLQHAFEEGAVHRDIKPSNLMLSRRGDRPVVKVLDFGLAKAAREQQADFGLAKANGEQQADPSLTHAGQMLGTPDYIAPEQIGDAQSADIRADIYSLGCTLYYLLSGGPPFQAAGLPDLLQAHFSMNATMLNLVRPEVPAELAALVAKLMAKEPARRFQTPREVAEALKPFFKRVGAEGFATEQSAAGQPGVGRGRSPTSPPTEPARKAAGSVSDPKQSVAARSNEPQWESLIQFKEAERSVKAAPAVDRARRPSWVWPSAAVGLLMCGLFAAWLGGVFKVKAPEGVIVLENLPRDAEVFVDGGKITLSWPGVGKPVEIRAAPGQRKVEVKKDGFSTFGKELTVKADGSEEVAVRLEPLDARLSNPEGSPSHVPSPPAGTGDPFPVNGKKYRLINVQSGKALEARERIVDRAGVSNRVVVQAAVSDSGNQVWYFSKVPNTSKYKIFNFKINSLINISNGGPERFSVILYPDVGGEAGEDNAVWFLHSEGRAVRIATSWPAVVSSHGVNVLKIPDGSKDEERVVQLPMTGGKNELWEWIEVSPKAGTVGTGGPFE